jgi:hypothetical protein
MTYSKVNTHTHTHTRVCVCDTVYFLSRRKRNRYLDVKIHTAHVSLKPLLLELLVTKIILC